VSAAHLLGLLVEPGFLASAPVRTALVVGGVVALVAGVVGVFTVLRGQSFAGHSLGDLSATGGAGAFLVGISPLWGFVGGGLAAGAVLEVLGIRRLRGRDVATGVVLGAALGLAALFLYLDANDTNTTGATMTVFFGSLFSVSGATVPLSLGLSALVLAVVMVLFRPLLLSTVSPEIAAARGVAVRWTGLAYLLALALSVSLAALTIGAILSTALLIGPAATACRLTRRPGAAIAAAGAIGVAATWLGVLVAYDSYYWSPGHQSWPVSFVVVTLVFAGYLGSGLLPRGRRRPVTG
jgi:zinc/manganese transport system permease protein